MSRHGGKANRRRWRSGLVATGVAAVFALCVSASSLGVSAAQTPAAVAAPQSIARAYLDAYAKRDWAGMGALMAPDIVLRDETNPDPAFPVEHVGRDAVLAVFQGFVSSQGVQSLRFDAQTVFESNGVVVLSGALEFDAAPPPPARGYRLRTDQVTAITVRDGKVVRHQDFANYRTPSIRVAPDPVQGNR